MRSDLIYVSFRVGFVLLLTAGFLIFLAYPSVQKYIKGGIMVEVFENKSEISAYMFVFIHLCFVSIVCRHARRWCRSLCTHCGGTQAPVSEQ